MKYAGVSIGLLLSALMMSGNGEAHDGVSVPNGPYLGQTPPGTTAKPFAPGIVNTEEWGGRYWLFPGYE